MDMKKVLIYAFILFIPFLFSLPIVFAQQAQPVAVKCSSHQFYLDGEEVACSAYIIKDSNYIKLLDLAYILNNTSKQVSVSWNDSERAISLRHNQPYALTGQEMTDSPNTREAVSTFVPVFVDGIEIALNGYYINGHNYYKLRELAQALDFGIIWRKSDKSVRIESGLRANMEIDLNLSAKTEEEEFTREIVRLVNTERAEKGLKPLIADAAIFAAAQVRAEELTHQLSHERPNGEHFYSVLDEFGIEYNGCAENAAYGQRSPAIAFNSWITSPNHKENFYGDYTRTGVGVVKYEGYYYWDELFI